MESFVLDKAVWTETDFNQMGWHDTTLWSMFTNPDNFECVFDLDYIFKWIDPEENEKYYKFFVAPATMVFENISDIKIDIESSDGSIEVADLCLEDSSKIPNGKMVKHAFRFDCQQGEILLTATGFKMYVRRKPKLIDKQRLDLNERGGVSFERVLKPI